jgi:tRNA-dihydrouridine synthase B
MLWNQPCSFASHCQIGQEAEIVTGNSSLTGMATKPNFLIGTSSIYGDVLHAPMDGYTDSPYRTIAREYGSAITYTEFMNSNDILTNPVINKLKVIYSEKERPIAFQVYDEEPERIIKSCIFLSQYQPDFLDINMGCSTPTVSGRGAGAGLLKEPKKIARIFSHLSKECDIPITAKIRLGWDNTLKNYLEVAKTIEENGGKMIAVHARTRAQGMTGRVDLQAISEIKQHSKIPIIGNGDILSVADIDRMKLLTGCDAIMIGRATIGNPWILCKKEIKAVKSTEVLDVVSRHLEMMVAIYGEFRGVIRFRKHLKRYLQQTINLSLGEIRLFMNLKNMDEIISLLNKYY